MDLRIVWLCLLISFVEKSRTQPVKDTTTDETCRMDEFTCSNGNCVPQRWLCDHEDDCGDDSDELNCKTCSPDTDFACVLGGNKTYCINARWRCDGDNDCPDGSDEKNCTDNPQKTTAVTGRQACLSREFQCHHNKMCIPVHQRCNGVLECTDGSDEMDCRKECLTNDECISGKICIAKKCTDPCDSVCGLNTICVVHEGAPVCSCKTGYKGDPFTECKPQNAGCTDDSMCPSDKICIGRKCLDPCLDYCGLNTMCRVVNHRPVCACLNGFFYKLDIRLPS
ncbi:low-density lipoprotein receptor-related protein 1B-like [Macrosteles quadrilineatus]|uniref:low-density lipoprotein receptor-related protein 1B-like n=1 Tax=Macrosteles quadrilineatus TaxID=74068 RepID=UPI0023E32CF3|nr:low-density lipoprotein receptor-related protein 1B-like [Macrosteles quadrilineatus]